MTELAALMTVATYSPWSLFVRHFSMDERNGKGFVKHDEAKASRSEFLRLPGAWTNKVRRSILRLALNDGAWQRRKKGYRTILGTLEQIAPQWLLEAIRPPPTELVYAIL